MTLLSASYCSNHISDSTIVSGSGFVLSNIFAKSGSLILISSKISSFVLYSASIHHSTFFISSSKSITSTVFLSYLSSKYKEIVNLELMLSISLKLTS